jgi:hypothetical protein
MVSSIDRRVGSIPETSTIHVELAGGGGWNLRVEVDGQVMTTEHFSDWHRLERRRACLALHVTSLGRRAAA